MKYGIHLIYFLITFSVSYISWNGVSLWDAGLNAN